MLSDTAESNVEDPRPLMLQFFHTEQECRRGGGAQPRGTGTAQSEQIHRQQQGPTTSSNGGNQVSGYHGPMGPRPETTRQPSGVHAGQLQVNPTFSPQGGGEGQQSGHGTLNGQYQARGFPPLDGQGGMGQTGGGLSAQMGQMLGSMNMGGGEGGTGFAQPQGVHPMPWQGGATSEWLLANGIHPALWVGMMGRQGTTPMLYQQGTQAGQQGASGVGSDTDTPISPIRRDPSRRNDKQGAKFPIRSKDSKSRKAETSEYSITGRTHAGAVRSVKTVEEWLGEVGFGDTTGRSKRARIKAWIHENKISIVCFQETKLNNEKIGEMGRWWDDPQIWAAARGTRGEVGVLIHRNLEAIMEDYHSDLWGRWAWVILSQGGFRWGVATVYAPVDRKERCSFLEELRVSLPNVDELVIGGDWNMSLDAFPNQATKGCPKDVLALVDFMSDMDLHDAYRDLHPAEEGYTWFTHQGKGKRLDYILTRGDTRERPIGIAENSNPISDHKPVVGVFNFGQENPKCKGYFKLNVLNLRDKELNQWTQDYWRRWENQKERFATLADWWEVGSRILSNMLNVFSRVLAQNRNKEEERCWRKVLQAEEKMKQHSISELTWGKERVRRLAIWDQKQQEKSEVWAERTKVKGLEVYDRMTKDTFQKLVSARTGPTVKELKHPFEKEEPVAAQPKDIWRYATLYYKDIMTTRWSGEGQMQI
ncbi:hypothetical protein CBR_g23446 [Chara braunii]|uniref:Endonuclease/exonuclease/phosphatase domain-containing protein n=1 Tax=Chara braunii TaxID=69332 RepID=A0A388L486_CHABU|nr:hypothetical protein CBR_g23446 [Chara braunii]|eukprot:GBG77120.1 hypothetical protein CBR_g23446 [Chara braunii]